MKLYTQGYNPDKVGGGHTFLKNFRKCFKDNIVDNPEDCDIFFITSISMLGKLSEIPKDKKIVLRVDNILKRSCNRDIYPFEGDKVTMMEALKLVAKKSDLVVYQSEWSKELLNSFLQPKKSVVIMNSADENIFKYCEKERRPRSNVYLYSRSSNHDNKGWHKCYYEYQKIHKSDPNSQLWIVGRFSPENIPNNFDFFNGENISYFGYITDPEVMSTYFRLADTFMYHYSFDACSNTLIEAYLSGCEVNMYDDSGGAKEIKDKFVRHGREYFYLGRMKKEYENAFNEMIRNEELTKDKLEGLR